MKKFFAYAFIASVLSVAVTSCGKDDDSEPSKDSGTLLPIPVSVVDGVRVTSVKTGNTEFSKFVYNPDGSVASATVDGVRYKFEYESTRASERVEYTDSRLVRIVLDDEEEGTVSAYGFSFDDKTGFVTRWFEAREYESGKYYDRVTGSFTPVYNSEGRIVELKFSGKEEWNDPDEGKGSESGSGVIHYRYNGTNLVASTYDDPEDGKSEFTLGYSGAPLNSFNIVPYPLYYAMGHGEGSVVAGMLAHLGFLGYPSSSLPTSYGYRGDDYEDTGATMSYHTNSAGQVVSMDMTLDGYRPVTFNFAYNK